MPLYTHKCTECGKTSDFGLPCSQRDEPQKCDCGGETKRDFATELKAKDNINGLMKENERYSLSMGCHVEDIPAMMKQYPGSEYNKQGQLKIKNRAHKLYEMKRRGYAEYA